MRFKYATLLNFNLLTTTPAPLEVGFKNNFGGNIKLYGRVHTPEVLSPLLHAPRVNYSVRIKSHPATKLTSS